MLKRIKNDMLEAKKSGDKLKGNLLSTLYGEAVRVGKDNGNRESTDGEVIKVIQKFVNGLEETIEAKKKIGREFENEKRELEILEGYLPEMLTEEKLSEIIDGYISKLEEKSMKAMGGIMKKLKEEHEGLYDGKLASQIVKEKLMKS